MPSILDGFYSLAQKINKNVKGDRSETAQGVVSALLPELNLDMDDKQLISMKRQWEKSWSEYYEKAEKRMSENEKYWLGKHFPGTEARGQDRPMADNLIFEALETALPIITRQNPEPVVFSNETEEGKFLADRTRKMLIYLSDVLQFKLKLKKVARFWALYLLGVAKVGWSEVTNDIDVKILRPQKLILDKDATVTENGEYTGEYVGEYREDLASNLIKRFPEKAEYIKEKCEGKLGTKMRYIEWWTDEYFFSTLDDEVLQKAKNPHWNYPSMQEQMDEMGNVAEVEVKGYNHFPVPKKPYIFLSVFNLGLHPLDDVSIIEQNLALQDLINKRLRQIDRNIDSANGGLVVSGANSGLSKEQAADATEALRRGGTVYIASGNVNDAIKREPGVPLPPAAYESLIDYRKELRDIYGISASTGEGIKSTETVRGKILAKGSDESRMALISEYIEQFSDKVFNWFVQLMCVYYDEPHVASVIGEEQAREFISLKSSDFNSKLVVSVQEGSLVPRDPLTKRNEALDLWSAGAIDPFTLLDRLEFPNPREAVKKLYQWQSNPASFFPDLAPPMMGAAPGGVPPDAPPEGAPEGAPVQPAPDQGDMAAVMPQVQSDLSNVPIN